MWEGSVWRCPRVKAERSHACSAVLELMWQGAQKSPGAAHLSRQEVCMSCSATYDVIRYAESPGAAPQITAKKSHALQRYSWCGSERRRRNSVSASSNVE